MLKLYCYDISSHLKNNDSDLLHGYISPERVKKINRMKFHEDKLRSLYAELLIRFALVRDFDFKNDSIHFSSNTYGKPVLEGHGEIYFNLSHSGCWIVCAISDDLVGVDVEKINESNNSFMELILHPKELLFINSVQGNEKNTNYYKLWCLKESYGKCLGLGLNFDLKKVYFEIKNNIWSLTTEKDHYSSNYHFSLLNVATDYLVAVCSVRNHTPDLYEIDFKDLTEEFFER